MTWSTVKSLSVQPARLGWGGHGIAHWAEQAPLRTALWPQLVLCCANSSPTAAAAAQHGRGAGHGFSQPVEQLLDWDGEEPFLPTSSETGWPEAGLKQDGKISPPQLPPHSPPHLLSQKERTSFSPASAGGSRVHLHPLCIRSRASLWPSAKRGCELNPYFTWCCPAPGIPSSRDHSETWQDPTTLTTLGASQSGEHVCCGEHSKNALKP